MLQTNYDRGTKDSDVFDTVDFAADTKELLLRLAGVETELAHRRRMYVEIVRTAIVDLDGQMRGRALTVTLEVNALDL